MEHDKENTPVSDNTISRDQGLNKEPFKKSKKHKAVEIKANYVCPTPKDPKITQVFVSSKNWSVYVGNRVHRLLRVHDQVEIRGMGKAMNTIAQTLDLLLKEKTVRVVRIQSYLDDDIRNIARLSVFVSGGENLKVYFDHFHQSKIYNLLSQMRQNGILTVLHCIALLQAPELQIYETNAAQEFLFSLQYKKKNPPISNAEFLKFISCITHDSALTTAKFLVLVQTVAFVHQATNP